MLIGEASHGTYEFYCERAVITQRLIAAKGFTVVAVEADWPDAYRVNRWVRDASPDRAQTERQSHYYHAVVSDQFDALLHFDHSRAVEPLERTAAWAAPEVPETFPTGV